MCLVWRLLHKNGFLPDLEYIVRTFAFFRGVQRFPVNNGIISVNWVSFDAVSQVGEELVQKHRKKKS